MKFSSNSDLAYKVFYLLKSFFYDLIWDENSDFVFRDNEFYDKNRGKSFKVSKNTYLKEIYDYIVNEYSLKNDWGILQGVRPVKLVHRLLDSGLEEREIHSHLNTKYGLSSRVCDLLYEVASTNREIYTGDRNKKCLYISIPFCPSLCSFCNFHTVIPKNDDIKRYIDIIEHKINALDIKEVDVVYIGGGTPSILGIREIERLFRAIYNKLNISDIKELTFEAGRCDTLSREKLELLSKYSTRISINPQTFNEEILRTYNRPNTNNFREFVDISKRNGLNINSDVIVGFDKQNKETLSRTIEILMNMGVDEVTVHNLSIKKGSEIWDKNYKSRDNNELLFLVKNVLKSNGYRPYYLYRQKNMLGQGFNAGYTKNKISLYNVRMLEDSHEIIGIGANSVSKVNVNGRIMRKNTMRNIYDYIKNEETS